MNRIKYITARAGAACLLAALISYHTLYSQNQKPLLELTTENGLTINSVNDLMFDRQGFLWIATADGLQLFDGYRMQTFRNETINKKSLAHNDIKSVYEDQNENLWVSHHLGISFKPKGKFDFYNIDMPYILKNTFYCVGETDSTVLIMNYPDGIYSVNKTTQYSKKVFPFPEINGNDGLSLLSKFTEKNEHVWLRKTKVLNDDLFLLTTAGLKHHKNTAKTNILFIIPAKKDSITVITDKMIYKTTINHPFNSLRILKEPFDSKALDNDFMTWPRKIGKNQYLLIGTKKILLYDEDKEKITPFTFGGFLPENETGFLHVAIDDKKGNSWLGYNGIGGVKALSGKKFNRFTRPDEDALIYCLAGDAEGKIYAGIYRGDVEVYNKEGQFLKKIQLPPAHKRLGSPRTMAMIDSETLIVKSTFPELYAIHTETGFVRIISHLLPKGSDSAASVEFEPALQTIKDGEVWYSYKNMIVSLKKTNNVYTSSVVCSIATNDRINSFCKNEKGDLWIGTTSGIWYAEKNRAEKLSLPIGYVKYISLHPDKKIWVSTTNGIFILQNNQLLKRLNTNDGVPNDFVYGALFDDEGNGWISTNKGLAKVVPPASSEDTAWKITTYSAKGGLQSDEFNTKGFYKNAEGTLYFAGVGGINFFNPQELRSEPSPTLLTGIEVNNQPYSVEVQPWFIQKISVPHWKNNIRLSFSCMDFTAPDRNRYKFWLKGFQDDWSLPQTNNTVQYVLPAGEYQLHVLGANHEGLWNNEPLVLYISILPPWYQTTWAKIVIGILILGSVGAIFYFISRSRYRKKLRKLQMEQEVQKEKQRLSRDLHDNLGSQITWLSNNITQLEDTQRLQQPAEQKINRLKEGIAELMGTLRETIWILNKDKIGCLELFDKVVTHAAKYLEAYPSMQLHTEEKVLSGKTTSSGQALQVFRICQEAVTNACKHASASLLIISAFSTDNSFTILISDNGKGFDMNSKNNSGHYGLQNMEERARESNLQLKVESSVGNGTIITVSLQT